MEALSVLPETDALALSRLDELTPAQLQLLQVSLANAHSAWMSAFTERTQ